MEPSVVVGSRVSTTSGNGTVRFTGTTAFAPGRWIGVELDVPNGKNNGTVQGKAYFTCRDGYGVFVRIAGIKAILADVAPSRKSVEDPARGRITAAAAAATATREQPPVSMSQAARSVSSTTAPQSTSSPFKTPGLPASKFTMQTPTMTTPRHVSSPAPSSAQTTPRPTVTQKISQSPATGLNGTPKLDPRHPRRTIGATSPTRQSLIPETPERSPERSPDKSLLSSPEKSHLSSESPVKRSPPAFRTRLPSSDSPEAVRPKREATDIRTQNREIEELTAKLRILEQKRIEDRRKIRAYEASKDAESTLEKHKEKLQAKMTSMAEEIRHLKSVLKDTETQLSALQASAAENAEVLEMATLDREMAEERVEVLQLELDSLKERQEELVAENELLKSENEEFIRGAGPVEGGDAERSAGSLQLERQNERLKDALVRLRDVTGKREAELRDEISALTEEIEQLTAIKDRFEEISKALAQSEALIEDLKQQLDTALSAEDLLEELTERNLSLTEKVEEMKATIEDLEALREVNDELEENHLATERELREEAEFKESLIREQTKRIQTAEETNLDYESTIMRFRELVLSLQSDVETLRQERQSSEEEAKNLSSRSREMMDLNLKLQATSTKSLAKAIDFELRKEHAIEAEEQLNIVKAYLPDAFESERSSIQGLLRFKRLSFKSRILRTFLGEQHTASADPKAKPSSFDADHAIARTLVMEQLVHIQSVTATFAEYFSKCDAKEFEGASAIFHELDPVERNLDHWLTNLRSGEMNEQACSDSLRGSLAMLAHLAEIFIKDPLRIVPWTLRGLVSSMDVCLDTFSALYKVLKVQMPKDIDAEDGLIYDVLRKCEGASITAQTAKGLVGKLERSVDEMRSRGLTVELRHVGSVDGSYQQLKSLAGCYRKVVSELSKIQLYSASIDPQALEICLDNLSSEYKEYGSDVFDGIIKKLATISTHITSSIQVMNDFDKTIELELPSEPPWIHRSRDLKATKQIDADLTHKLALAQSEIKDLILQLKLKEKTLEESQVKIKLLDSRMGNVKKQADRIAALEKAVADAKAREVQFEEAIEGLNGDLRNAEAEAGKWRKAVKEGKGGGAMKDERSEGANLGARMEEVRLSEKIETLQGALQFLRLENSRIQHREAQSDGWLHEPLLPPSKVDTPAAMVEQRRVALMSDLRKFMSTCRIITAKDVGIGGRGWKSTKTTAGYLARSQQEQYRRLCARKDALLMESHL